MKSDNDPAAASKMRLLIVLAVTAIACASAAVFRGRPELDSHWENFKGKHGKKYRHSAEEAERRQHWEANRDRIDEHNKQAAAGLHTYTLKENHMADWTAEERQKLRGRKSSLVFRDDLVATVDYSEIDRQTLPASVDLRTQSCMAPIQDQGNCGSCWAFGSTAATEYRLCRKKGTFVKLSEQQLVDCDPIDGGCNGGDERYAWMYVFNATGQTTAAKYPYASGSSGLEGTCTFTRSMAYGTITSYVPYIPKTNLAAIQSQLAYTGTVTASLDVVSSFEYYGNGVYSETACATDGKSANHVVALVGYGTLNGIPYWIVRNSWSTYWGINGYALIRRGSNTCNIESFVTYPVV